MSMTQILVGVALAALIILILVVILTNPGGPIIVVRPDPPDMNANPAITDYGILWNNGCTNPKDPDEYPLPANKKIMDGIPDRYAGNDVDKIWVRKKTGAAIDAIKIEFTVEGEPVVIDLPSHNTVAKWKFKNTDLTGKSEPKENWPADMWGRFENLQVTDTNQKLIPIDVKDLKWIKVYYKKKGKSECS